MANTTDSSRPSGNWKCPSDECNEDNPRIVVFCNKCGAAQLSEWQWLSHDRKEVRKYFRRLVNQEELAQILANYRAYEASKRAGKKSSTQATRDSDTTPDTAAETAAETATPSEENPSAAANSSVPASARGDGGDDGLDDEVEIVEPANRESPE